MPTITISIPQQLEDLNGLVDSINKIFTVNFNIDNSKPVVAYVNGQQNYLDEDFTITGANEITFISAPQISKDGTYLSKVKLEYYPKSV